MVEEGWALGYKRYSNGHYAEQQEQAKQEGRGLWAGEFQPPWEWRRQQVFLRPAKFRFAQYPPKRRRKRIGP